MLIELFPFLIAPMPSHIRPIRYQDQPSFVFYGILLVLIYGKLALVSCKWLFFAALSCLHGMRYWFPVVGPFHKIIIYLKIILITCPRSESIAYRFILIAVDPIDFGLFPSSCYSMKNFSMWFTLVFSWEAGFLENDCLNRCTIRNEQSKWFNSQSLWAFALMHEPSSMLRKLKHNFVILKIFFPRHPS